jgi:hypothetical protein
MKKIDKLAALDAAIQRETETVQNLEAKLEKTLADKVEAERVQQEIAYLAETDNDPEAREKLEQVEETLFKVEKRTRSLEIALAKGKEKLQALRDDRQQAFVAEKRREYAVQGVGLLKDDAEKLEQALTLMSQAREVIRARLLRMEALGLQAGIDTSHAHKRIRENLRHCVEQRGQFESVWMSREVRETFKQPIAVLIQSTLKTLIPEIEDQERKIA